MILTGIRYRVCNIKHFGGKGDMVPAWRGLLTLSNLVRFLSFEFILSYGIFLLHSIIFPIMNTIDDYACSGNRLHAIGNSEQHLYIGPVSPAFCAHTRRRFKMKEFVAKLLIYCLMSHIILEVVLILYQVSESSPPFPNFGKCTIFWHKTTSRGVVRKYLPVNLKLGGYR